MKKNLAYALLILSVLLSGFGHAEMAHHATATLHDGIAVLSTDSGSMQKVCVEPCEKDKVKNCCGSAISHCENNMFGSSQQLNGSSAISTLPLFCIPNAQHFGIAQTFDPPPPKV